MPQTRYVLSEYRPTRFEEAIRSVRLPPDFPMLPLIHCADIAHKPGSNVRTAGEILRDGRIEPVLCDVFSEDLVYTYVGRPAYREFERPVCFILKPLPKLLQNLFVFDTGAYSIDRYGKLVDNLLDIHLFRIPARKDSVKAFILKYFGSNENYFFSRESRRNLSDIEGSIEEFDYEMFCILGKFGNLQFDDRCRTLENIIRGPVELERTLQGIVLPASSCTPDCFPGWNGYIAEGVDVMIYDDQDGAAAPSECHDALSRELFAYYLRKGYCTAYEA